MVTAERLGSSLLVALLAIGLGMTTVMPGVGFWDTAELQTVAPVLGTAHPTGFPTYVLLGWFASVVLGPIGDAAFRLNVFSVLCVALAAGVTVDLVRALSASRALGLAAGAGLACSPLAWSIGTRAEAHALHLALVAILLRLLVAWEDRRRAEDRGQPDRGSADRWLVAAAIAFAVSAGNHSLTLLLAPPIALYVLAVEPGIVRRPRFIATCALALTVALVVLYLQLPLRAGPFRAPLVYGRPDTWDGFWAIVLAEQFRGSLVDPFGDLGGKVLELGRRAVEQFGPMAAALPFALAATVLRRPRYALLSGTAVLITVLFSAAYVNADIARYDLGPLLIAWSWLGILGATVVDALTRVLRERITVVGSPLIAAVVAIILIAPTVIELPDRQRLVDRSRDHTAARWLDAAVAQLESDAVVVSWWSYSTPLWYAQHVEGRLPGVAIIDDRTRLDEGLGSFVDVIERHLGDRPVYVVRSDPREQRLLEEEYVIEPLDMPMPSSLHRVIARRDATP